VVSTLNMFDGATAVIERHQPVFLR
jgi:hypothetical protein